MDLSKLDLTELDLSASAEAGNVVEIEHPISGEDTGIRITVLGTDSKKYKDKVREQQQARFNKAARSRSRKSANIGMSDEEASELLAACTVSWSGVKENGDEVPVEQAARIYTKYSWIREQVDEFMGDRANFFTTA